MPGSGRSPGEGLGYPLQYSWASLVTHMVKNLPAMRETWVQSLGWEDSLEKGMATHSSILAWRIPWAEEPDELESMGSQRVRPKWATRHSTARHEQGWKGRLKGPNIQNNNAMSSGKSIWQQSLCPCLTKVPRLLCDSELVLLCFECCSFLNDTEEGY